MSETTYIIDLTPEGQNRYRHRHVLERNRIVEFSVQYEAFLFGKWHSIVRYDSAHNIGHRDLLHPNGTETKTTFRNWDYAQVLTFGERDLKQNWQMY
jgi:hypothetical protein